MVMFRAFEGDYAVVAPPAPSLPLVSHPLRRVVVGSDISGSHWFPDGETAEGHRDACPERIQNIPSLRTAGCDSDFLIQRKKNAKRV